LLVGVDDVDHHAIVLVESRVGRDDEAIGHLERAAERRAVMTEREAGRRHRRRFRRLPAAGRQSDGEHEKDRQSFHQSRPPRGGPPTVRQLLHLSQSVSLAPRRWTKTRSDWSRPKDSSDRWKPLTRW